MSNRLYYGNGIPPGIILPFPAPIASTPAGFLPCDGSNYDAVVTPAYAGLYKKLVTDLGFTEQTFTYSTTNILSKTAHGFLGGELIQVRTSGSLPTGLIASNFYYVVYVNANTFSLSVTPDSSNVVSITAAGSGTHTYKQSLFGLGTTYDGTGSRFTVPDMRGVIPQGIGPAAGFVQTENLALAQKYNDRSHGHAHAQKAFVGAAGSGISNAFNGSGTYQGSAAPSLTDVAASNGVDGTPRMGNTTRPKVMGLNWIIKY